MNEEEARKRYINEPVVPFSLSNPHPLYGKDPNIMNEFGHTHYPKWIDVNGQQVLANNAKHEKVLLAANDKTSTEPDLSTMSDDKTGDKHDLVLDPPLKAKKTWNK